MPLLQHAPTRQFQGPWNDSDLDPVYLQRAVHIRVQTHGLGSLKEH